MVLRELIRKIGDIFSPWGPGGEERLRRVVRAHCTMVADAISHKGLVTKEGLNEVQRILHEGKLSPGRTSGDPH